MYYYYFFTPSGQIKSKQFNCLVLTFPLLTWEMTHYSVLGLLFFRKHLIAVLICTKWRVFAALVIVWGTQITTFIFIFTLFFQGEGFMNEA